MIWLVILFIGVPLIEIALFIQVGGLLTLWPTLGIVVATALLGSWLMRMQGLRAWTDIQRSLDRFEDPLGALAHGAMVLVAGVLLITPGFLTDTVGFALLVPRVRTALLRAVLARRAAATMRAQSTRARDTVIEAEFHEVTPPGDHQGPQPRKPSGDSDVPDTGRPPGRG